MAQQSSDDCIVQRRHPERQPRIATLTLRTTTVELQPPNTHSQRQHLQPVCIQVIQALEVDPPPGVEPVNWLLLTTLAINCFEDLVQCLRWYSYRWLIERYHYSSLLCYAVHCRSPSHPP